MQADLTAPVAETMANIVLAAEDSLVPPSPSSQESGDASATSAPGGDDYLSVLADPVNFNIKHPLYNSWTLWYDGPGRKTTAQSWSQNLKLLVSFDTVEDFWGVYNNVAKATELSAGANYHLFKTGVKPMWEDAANAKGGKWVVQMPKAAAKAEDVNEYWLGTMLACIGESFDVDNEICGAVMSNRKAYFRIALWTRTSNRRDVCEAIGRQFKALIGYSGKIEFMSHAEAARGKH